MEFSNWAYLMDQKEVHSKMNNTGKGGCSLEAQISSARPRSLEMLHRRTKSSLICLSTVLDDIIDSTWEDGVSLLSVSRFVAGLSLGRNNSHSAPWFRPRSYSLVQHTPRCVPPSPNACVYPSFPSLVSRWLKTEAPRTQYTYHEDGHERGRLREKGPKPSLAAKPADHRQPEEEVVRPRHDVGVHVAQTAGVWRGAAFFSRWKRGAAATAEIGAGART